MQWSFLGENALAAPRARKAKSCRNVIAGIQAQTLDAEDLRAFSFYSRISQELKKTLLDENTPADKKFGAFLLLSKSSFEWHQRVIDLKEWFSEFFGAEMLGFRNNETSTAVYIDFTATKESMTGILRHFLKREERLRARKEPREIRWIGMLTEPSL